MYVLFKGCLDIFIRNIDLKYLFLHISLLHFVRNATQKTLKTVWTSLLALFVWMCVYVCVCACVFVTNEDINLYNDMGMT